MDCSWTRVWTRPRKEVKDDEYQELYKHISHDFEDPLSWSHNRVEGKLEYTSLLYIPGRAPFDLFVARSYEVFHSDGIGGGYVENGRNRVWGQACQSDKNA